MYTNADVTLYLYSKNGKTEKYIRLPVEGVYWEDVKRANTLMTGQSNADSVLIVIPLESLSCPISFTPGKDLAVKGLIDFEVDNTSPAALSASLSELKNAYRFVTVTTVDGKLFGNEAVQHYELSCR